MDNIGELLFALLIAFIAIIFKCTGEGPSKYTQNYPLGSGDTVYHYYGVTNGLQEQSFDMKSWVVWRDGQKEDLPLLFRGSEIRGGVELIETSFGLYLVGEKVRFFRKGMWNSVESDWADISPMGVSDTLMEYLAESINDLPNERITVLTNINVVDTALSKTGEQIITIKDIDLESGDSLTPDEIQVSFSWGNKTIYQRGQALLDFYSLKKSNYVDQQFIYEFSRQDGSYRNSFPQYLMFSFVNNQNCIKFDPILSDSLNNL